MKNCAPRNDHAYYALNNTGCATISKSENHKPHVINQKKQNYLFNVRKFHSSIC